MQLTLNYVHLVNFRVHEDYMFKPSSNGITAILGSNAVSYTHLTLPTN